jgi:hypothetical protein
MGRSFLAVGNGRFVAWKKKHLSHWLDLGVSESSLPEPDWWDRKCQALPGWYIVTQEDDLGSITVFTLRYVGVVFSVNDDIH